MPDNHPIWADCDLCSGSGKVVLVGGYLPLPGPLPTMAGCLGEHCACCRSQHFKQTAAAHCGGCIGGARATTALRNQLSEALAIVEALVKSPVPLSEGPLGDLSCMLCHGDEYPRPFTHEAMCPYRLAREWVAAERKAGRVDA